MYYKVALICFKAHDGDWYLLASAEDDQILIFAVKYIPEVSETESTTTFSLPDNFDRERFAQQFFDAEKIM